MSWVGFSSSLETTVIFDTEVRDICQNSILRLLDEVQPDDINKAEVYSDHYIYVKY